MADVENKVDTPVDAPVDGATPAVDAPTIGLADLQNAVKVIDHACEQGAFKGWQVIDQVMAVRNKLVAFLVATMPKEEPKPEPKAKKTKAVPVKKVTAKPAAKRK